MNSLKSIVTEKDTWNVSDGEYNGNLFILRYRPNLQAFTETREYSTRFTIIWEFESDNSILPEETQLEVMVKVEDELVNALENDLHTVLAFIYTSQKKKNGIGIQRVSTKQGKELIEYWLSLNSFQLSYFRKMIQTGLNTLLL